MLLTTYATGGSSIELFTSNPPPAGLTRPAQATFTALVTPDQASGTVQFFNGAIAMGSSALSGGYATWGQGFTAAGSYPISAVYAGATSNTVNQIVN